MAINVTLGEAKPQDENPFPKLMIATKDADMDCGIIVLFDLIQNGTVIKTVPGSHKHIGYYSSSFVMSCFEDYNEPLTLQNA